ncbi:MAG: ribonuclease III [Gammaproteobacteria bacterium]|nr:ribonuclease III [Gammaproteobacteria bacterium]|tara:strand:+ start:92 stop:796 length:705 start_codon:yes stop_codon:yes gene_type:complete
MIDDAVLRRLQASLRYTFADEDLLVLALTHRSAATPHNQRLEFLGDAALGLVSAQLLYLAWPQATEGELSQFRSRLVNQQTLAAMARELSLGEALLLGLGERKSGGRQRDSILCDAIEAVIGAVFLDGGFSACHDVVAGLLQSRLSKLAPLNAKDAKTRLQEIAQARAVSLPQYTVVNIEGEEHDQIFHVTCQIDLLSSPTSGSGRTRKLAEQQAASAALKQLQGKTSIKSEGS